MRREKTQQRLLCAIYGKEKLCLDVRKEEEAYFENSFFEEMLIVEEIGKNEKFVPWMLLLCFNVRKRKKNRKESVS